MSMRVLKSIVICLFLCSPRFFAASDVLDRRPQDIRKGAPGGGVPGQQSSLFVDASGTGAGTVFGAGEKERGSTADLLQLIAGRHVLGFRKGGMRESRPVARQEIEGNRVPGEVTYRLEGEQEIGFKAGAYDSQYPLAIGDEMVLGWNTFLGGSNSDLGFALAVDTSGNIYVTGFSNATWGSPVRPFSGASDAFVAKLNASGVLQWSTFLGGSGEDYSYGIAVDTSGNVYVTGQSEKTWGSPIRSFGGELDVFVAKLNTSGVLQWSTFLGGSDVDSGNGIAVDTGGNVYVSGESFAAWGSPIRSFGGGDDGFVAKLNTSGVLQWSTFLGGSDGDGIIGIAVDTIGNAYVTGDSFATWGSPIRPFVGENDAFVAKLNISGALQWSTFLGLRGSGDWSEDESAGLAIDTSGNVYVAGISSATWGSPVRPYAGGGDTFVAKLNASGALQWNTFLGGSGADLGIGIAVDTIGNVYATGGSNATWGSPARPYAGGSDAFVAKLNSGGALLSNTFLGGSAGDVGCGIAVDTGGSVYAAGYSDATWGSPVRPFGGGGDAFVASFKLVSPPSNLAAIRSTNRSVTQAESIVDLSWNANPANAGLTIAVYRVYQKIGDNWVVLADLPTNKLTYRIRMVSKAEQTFGVASVKEGGIESAKVTVVR